MDTASLYALLASLRRLREEIEELRADIIACDLDTGINTIRLRLDTHVLIVDLEETLSRMEAFLAATSE
jgi:hypothetical protein